MASLPAQGVASRLDPALVRRLTRLLPLAALVLAVFVFYGVEAWLRKTPWIFTDELQWTQISRAIAATGHAARRGTPTSFGSVYVFLIAPFWWLHSTMSAYAAIKYANVVLMTSTAIPTYLLARMLVSRRGALAAAVLAISVPAMSYVTTIIIEVVAYPYYALCSWLAVRGLASRRKRDLATATVAAFGGLLVRATQFSMIPVALALAALLFAATGARARALWRGSAWQWRLGSVVVALVLLAALDAGLAARVYQWRVATEDFRGRMGDLGLRALLSLTVGLGVLPLVCGLAALRFPNRRREPAVRAFAAWLAASIVCLVLYTAVKAAYLSTVFGTFWEERDLIYLSPLLIVATVAAFEAPRLDWRLVGAASAAVTALVILKQFQFGWPYFEAPGMAIPAVLYDYEGFGLFDTRVLMLGLLALGLLLLALRTRRGIPALALALGLAWLLGGEVANTVGMDRGANSYYSGLPTPPDWVDVAAHGAPVTYLGQEVDPLEREWLVEFWNSSIDRVESLDGSAPGPGPATRPLVVAPDGLLSGISGHYVLADNGVLLQATPVAERKEMGAQMILYHSPSGRWRLLSNVEQVYDDGWCPNFCAYTYFAPHERGTLEVTLSRTAYKGSWPAGRATVEVGTVGIDAQGAPYIVRKLEEVPALVRNGKEQTRDFPISSTPVRVVVTVANPIPPSSGDNRYLGAQVGFRFVPATRPRR